MSSDDVNALMTFGLDVLGPIMSEFWEWLYSYNKFCYYDLIIHRQVFVELFIKASSDNESDVLVKWWKYKDIAITAIATMAMKIINIKQWHVW